MTDTHDRTALPESPAAPDQAASSAVPPSTSPDPVPEADPIPRGCTAAQLRRFIKSRPYVPLHELRRRFELGGESDDVSSLDTPDGVTYVGLPPREGALIQELVRQGEIGVELSMDPEVRIVVGVYPMRPIPRP
jgi:hypothetical protein